MNESKNIIIFLNTLLKAFANEKGLLYVYDKAKDVVLKNPRSPKSVFFESDRNNITLPNGKTTSVLEDLFFSKQDNLLSAYHKYFWTTPITEINFSNFNIAGLYFFLVNLFWRIPLTDGVYHDILIQTKDLINEDQQIFFEQNPDFSKLRRAFIPKQAIDAILEYAKRGSAFVNMHQMPSPILAIGDNPFLFKENPTKFSEIGESNYLFAVSGSRLFSQMDSPEFTLTEVNALFYNSAIISQSIKYVCCPDLDFLTESVKMYRQVKDDRKMHVLKALAFVSR